MDVFKKLSAPEIPVIGEEGANLLIFSYIYENSYTEVLAWTFCGDFL